MVEVVSRKLEVDKLVDRILEQVFHKRVVEFRKLVAVSHSLELKFQLRTGIEAPSVGRSSLMMVDTRVVHRYYVDLPIRWLEGMDLMVDL